MIDTLQLGTTWQCRIVPTGRPDHALLQLRGEQVSLVGEEVGHQSPEAPLTLPHLERHSYQADAVLAAGRFVQVAESAGHQVYVRWRANAPSTSAGPLRSLRWPTRAATAPEGHTTQRYDVSDLVSRPPSRRLAVSPVPLVNEQGEDPDLALEQTRYFDIAWVRDLAFFGEAADMHFPRLRSGRGGLEVRTDPAGHRALEAQLQEIRTFSLRHVAVHAEWLEGPTARVATIAAKSTLSSRERAQLLTAPGIRVRDAGRVAPAHGRRAVLRSGRVRHFVPDFAVEIAGSAAMANPQPGQLFDGLELELRPTWDPAGVGTHLLWRFVRTHAPDALPHQATGNGRVQLARRTRESSAGAAFVAKGQSLVAYTVTHRDGTARVLLLTPYLQSLSQGDSSRDRR